MTLSKRHIPHFSYFEEIDVTELEELRQTLNATRSPEQPKLTYLPFIMLAGETDEEVVEAMGLLRKAGVELITLGQYLQPSWKHLAIDRFPEPSTFAAWDKTAREMGS